MNCKCLCLVLEETWTICCSKCQPWSVRLLYWNIKIKTGEKAQQLRAQFTLVEDLDSVPSTYMDAHNSLWLQFQGTQHSLLAFARTRYTVGAQTNTWTNPQAHWINKSLTYKNCRDRELVPWLPNSNDFISKQASADMKMKSLKAVDSCQITGSLSEVSRTVLSLHRWNRSSDRLAHQVGNRVNPRILTSRVSSFHTLCLSSGEHKFLSPWLFWFCFSIATGQLASPVLWLNGMYGVCDLLCKPSLSFKNNDECTFPFAKPTYYVKVWTPNLIKRIL